MKLRGRTPNARLEATISGSSWFSNALIKNAELPSFAMFVICILVFSSVIRKSFQTLPSLPQCAFGRFLV